MGEAPFNAPSSSEISFEPESSNIQETEEADQLEYILSEEQDFKAARFEPEKQKYSFQPPRTKPAPAL